MAYPKVRNFRGAWLDLVTYEMVLELAFRAGAITVNPIDGCGSLQGKTVQDADTGRVFTLPKTAASSDTHDGEGAVDIDCSQLSVTNARRVETLGRALGGVAYFRPAINPYTKRSYGWQPHVHMLRVGAALSPSALAQVQSYRDGLDGLSPARKDTGSRAYVGMTWAKYKEANVTNEQLQQILAAIAAVPGKTWNTPITLDPDGAGPGKANVSPASTYLKMADYFANKAHYNTDTLEASASKLSAAVATVATKADVDALKSQLEVLAAQVAALAPKA